MHPLSSLCRVTEIEAFVSVYLELSLRTVAEGDRSVHRCVPFQVKTKPQRSFQVEATEQEAHGCASGCKIYPGASSLSSAETLRGANLKTVSLKASQAIKGHMASKAKTV